MALMVRREIDGSMAYGHPQLYGKSSSGTILQDVTMSSMSGTLGQLGLISHYAAEMFQDLFSLTEDVFRRVEKIQSRTAKIVSQFGAIETKTTTGDGPERNRNGVGSMGSSGGVRRSTAEEAHRVTFDMASMPRALKERYESDEVQVTPDLSKIDALVPNHVEKDGPCARKFSYPGLFLDQWAAEEMNRIAMLKKKKAERKADRKERKRQALKDDDELEESATKPTGKRVVKSAGLNWKARYLQNDVGGTDLPRDTQIAPPDAANQSTSTISADVGGPSSPPSRVSSTGSKIRPPSFLSSNKDKSASPAAMRPVKDKITSSPAAVRTSKDKTSSPAAPRSASKDKINAPMIIDADASSPAESGSAERSKVPAPPPPPMPRMDSKMKAPPPPPPKLFSEVDVEEEVVDEVTVHTPAKLDVAVPEEVEDDDERFEAPKTAKESQEYAKFFTMMRMGIPKPAVQLKMTAEGLDPSILDEDSEDEDDETIGDDSQSLQSELPELPALMSKKPSVEDMAIDEPPPMPKPNALLGAIQQGAKLKKVEDRPASSSAPKNDLLAAIRGGGANLRTRTEEPAKPPAAAAKHNTGLFAVDKILSLREKVAADDSDSDDDDEWDSDDE